MSFRNGRIKTRSLNRCAAINSSIASVYWCPSLTVGSPKNKTMISFCSACCNASNNNNCPFCGSNRPANPMMILSCGKDNRVRAVSCDKLWVNGARLIPLGMTITLFFGMRVFSNTCVFNHSKGQLHVSNCRKRMVCNRFLFETPICISMK